MRNNYEPAAFLFPLPPELREQYYNWSKTHQKGAGADGNQPLFIPVCPAIPGTAPCPPNLQHGGGFTGMPGVNPFILFLILILLVFAFKKEQIVEAIKKMLK